MWSCEGGSGPTVPRAIFNRETWWQMYCHSRHFEKYLKQKHSFATDIALVIVSTFSTKKQACSLDTFFCPITWKFKTVPFHPVFLLILGSLAAFRKCCAHFLWWSRAHPAGSLYCSETSGSQPLFWEQHAVPNHALSDPQQSFNKSSNILCNRLCSAIKQNVSTHMC